MDRQKCGFVATKTSISLSNGLEKEATRYFGATALGKKSHFSDDEEDRHDEMLQPKQSSSKRRRVVESDGGNKEAAIDTTISDLRKIHGQQYTSLQYRLWAEMLDVGTHDDMDFPPNVPLFTGNNGHRSSKKFSLEGEGNPSSNVVQNAIQRSPKEPAGGYPNKEGWFARYLSAAITRST